MHTPATASQLLARWLSSSRVLSKAHLAALLADQAALALSASPAERLAALAKSCPALHKSGQILARNRRLSGELGVLADIGAEESRIDEVLLDQFLDHFAVEWPARWFALPDSRAFVTRLSNDDLARTMLSLPWTVT